jgi:hypothetical protein
MFAWPPSHRHVSQFGETLFSSRMLKISSRHVSLGTQTLFMSFTTRFSFGREESLSLKARYTTRSNPESRTVFSWALSGCPELDGVAEYSQVLTMSLSPPAHIACGGRQTANVKRNLADLAVTGPPQFGFLFLTIAQRDTVCNCRHQRRSARAVPPIGTARVCGARSTNST